MTLGVLILIRRGEERTGRRGEGRVIILINFWTPLWEPTAFLVPHNVTRGWEGAKRRQWNKEGKG